MVGGGGGGGGVGSVSPSSRDPRMHGDYAFVCVEFICLSVCLSLFICLSVRMSLFLPLSLSLSLSLSLAQHMLCRPSRPGIRAR